MEEPDGYFAFVEEDYGGDEDDALRDEMLAALAGGDYDDEPPSSSSDAAMDVQQDPASSSSSSSSSTSSSAVMQALNKLAAPSSSSSSRPFLPSSRSSGSGSGSSSSGSSGSFNYFSSRNPTPAEFAKELQKSRQALLAGGTLDAAASHTALNVTEMATQRPTVTPCDAQAFLHRFCVEGEAAHVPCVLANGTRFYLRRRQALPGSSSSGSGSTTESSGHVSLLSKSMGELQREADRIQTEALAERRLRETAHRDRELYGTDEADEFARESSMRAGAEQSKAGTALWVDKYAPREYSQLLSEERLNRDVLAALRAWSPYVFRETPSANSSSSSSSSAPTLNALGTLGGAVGIRSTPGKAPSPGNGALKATPGSNSKDKINGKRSSTKDRDDVDGGGSDMDLDNDDDNDNERSGGGSVAKDIRPFFKALLICGPPGTGKTTLAHVLAKHCGYRPFEVNASDDRSHDVLKDTLLRAMHGNTVMGSRQPNCIILDEIDGIDGRNSIDMLVKMIKAPLRAKGLKQKGQSSIVPVTRPLICICNDQYAPSLRELRRVAKVVVFRPPTEQRLVSRLQAVCTSEGISGVARSSLAALCLAAGNDIRSAINTLQFAALRTSNRVNGESGAAATAAGQTAVRGGGPSFGHMLSSMMSSGLKDVNRDAFQVWREIFSVREMALAAKKRSSLTQGATGETKGLVANNGETATTSSSTKPASQVGPQAAVQAMADFGDSSLILSGLFHNLPTIRYNDPSMARSHLAADWISAVDLFDCYAGGGEVTYQLMPYISSVAGAVHALCSTTEKVKVSWPSAEKDAFFKRKSRQNVLEALLQGARLGAPCLQNSGPAVLDVLSFLVDIISPRVRPVSFLTMSPEEQRAMQDCVTAMAAVGLRYSSVQADNSGGYRQNNLTLEPALMELVGFPPCDELHNRHVVLHSEVKSMILVELKKHILATRLAFVDANESLAGSSLESSMALEGNSVGDKRSSPSSSLQSPSKRLAIAPSEAELAEGRTRHAARQAVDEAEEEAHLKRMRGGRMDMFCKKENRVPNNAAARPSGAAQPLQPKREAGTLRFKYNQGYSNAVKRLVPITDFC